MWSHYGSIEYWNARYSDDPQVFEWLQNYQGISHLLSPNHLTPNTPFSIEKENTAPTFPPRCKAKVLILGCGNSRLGEDMLKDGWHGGITNVDFSDVVIDAMKTRYKDGEYLRKIESKFTRLQNKDDKTVEKMKCGNLKIPMLEFNCVDITKGLPYSENTFDLIICKGTLDAILCGSNASIKVKVMMEECCRVLRVNGSMVVVSHGAPESRLLYFENTDEMATWTGGIGVYRVPKPGVQGKQSGG